MKHTSALSGYDAMSVKKAEENILKLQGDMAGIEGKPLLVVVKGAGCIQTVTADPDVCLSALIGNAGLPADVPVKAIHVGYPLGGIFRPDIMGRPLSLGLFEDNGLHPGGNEIRVLFENTCMVDYLSSLAQAQRDESCGCCVFCREGLRQLQRITADIIKGNSAPDDLEMIRAISTGLAEGSRCLYGRAAGSLWLLTGDIFGGEIDAHIRRKQCPAMVCRKYISFHIQGSRCSGCGDCADVCPKDAIEGSSNYIHVIDQYECDRCGACAEKCPEGAIVKAGSVKPRTPETPIPVGSWRGK